MKKIIKKQYYKIEFELASSLTVGSGENNNTDKDIIVGSDNKPYIPASAIAGVCINMLDGKDKQEKKKYKDYWGYIDKATKVDNSSKAEESKIVFYDAAIIKGNDYITIRDSVSLDEYKTAIQRKKFDMETLEPGVKFRTFIEQSFYSEDDVEIARMVASYIKSGNVFLGAKTSRGYGAIKNVKVSEYEIFFKNADKDKIKIWAETCVEDLEDQEWKPANTDFSFDNDVYNERKIRISLKLDGGISIRRYTTDVPDEKEDTTPDFTQLTTSGEMMKPVIPGTSWAGAFEHQIRKYLGEDIKNSEEWKKVFGFVEEKSKQKSKIRFSESIIDGAESKILSRNAIDRFTGGAVDKALFTEKTYYGGTTELVIGIDESEKLSDKLVKALAASIVDLHYGFMAVGGETSIGRGIFTITAIDGICKIPGKNEIENANEFYENVVLALTGQAKEGNKIE